MSIPIGYLMNTDIHTKIERRPPFNPVENLDPFFFVVRGCCGVAC